MSSAGVLLQTTLTFNTDLQFGPSEIPAPGLRQPFPVSPFQKGKEKLMKERAAIKERPKA